MPAIVTGIDIESLLNQANTMVQRCAASVEPPVNPGVLLGIILGTAARSGVDKITIITSPAFIALAPGLSNCLLNRPVKMAKELFQLIKSL